MFLYYSDGCVESSQVTPTASTAPDLFSSLQQMADAAFAARVMPSVGEEKEMQDISVESTSEDNEPNNKTSIKTDARAANNPMSVSVPNLTSNMDTVSLLESFAAVARRNLSANTNNMVRSSNASNFMRMALSANTNGKHLS